MKYLTLDIGNTRTKASIYDDLRLIHSDLLSIGDLPEHVDRSISAATGIHQDEWMNAVLSISDYHIVLDHNTALPIDNQYQSPETLGRDRLAAVCGAHALFPTSDCLVVDAGTCITYDFINAEGQYLGGNIAPGMHMRLQAMHDYTARLPLPDLEYHDFALGRDTHSALQNGAIHGIRYEIEGLKARYERKGNNFKLILTGGDAPFLSNTLESGIFDCPDLVSRGLLSILKYNDY